MFGGGEQLPDCEKIVLWDGIPWNWDWEAAPTRNRDPQHPRQPAARLGSEICPARELLLFWATLGVPAACACGW